MLLLSKVTELASKCQINNKLHTNLLTFCVGEEGHRVNFIFEVRFKPYVPGEIIRLSCSTIRPVRITWDGIFHPWNILAISYFQWTGTISLVSRFWFHITGLNIQGPLHKVLMARLQLVTTFFQSD